MSLYDPPKQERLSDTFPLGTLFWLLGGKYEGIQPTTFGDSEQATIVAAPVGEPTAAKQYRVWGTLAEQVREMEEGDIPAEVEVAQEGRRHVFRLSKHLHDTGTQPVTTSPDEDIPF